MIEAELEKISWTSRFSNKPISQYLRTLRNSTSQLQGLDEANCDAIEAIALSGISKLSQ